MNHTEALAHIRKRNKATRNTDSARWLRDRGCSVKESGVGYTVDVRFDQTKVRTNAKDANTIYLNRRFGKAGR